MQPLPPPGPKPGTPGPPQPTAPTHVPRGAVAGIGCLGALVIVTLLAVIGTLAPPPEEAPPVASASAVDSPAPERSTTAPPASSAPPPAAPDPSPTSAPPPPPVPAPTVQEVHGRLAAVHDLPNPRDNTEKWRAIGLTGLLTTDAVSIYQWPTAADAKKWAGDNDSRDQVGQFVLMYSAQQQRATPPAVRKRLAAELRELLNGR